MFARRMHAGAVGSERRSQAAKLLYPAEAVPTRSSWSEGPPSDASQYISPAHRQACIGVDESNSRYPLVSAVALIPVRQHTEQCRLHALLQSGSVAVQRRLCRGSVRAGARHAEFQNRGKRRRRKSTFGRLAAVCQICLPARSPGPQAKGDVRNRVTEDCAVERLPLARIAVLDDRAVGVIPCRATGQHFIAL